MNGTGEEYEEFLGGPCNSTTPFLVTRFYLVSVFGSTLALLAIAESVLLMYVLFTRPFFRRSYFLYFGALAVADFLVGVGYVLIISASLYFEFVGDFNLMRIWYSYVIVASTVSQVSLLMPPYLLLAASLERYLSVLGLSNLCTTSARAIAIAVVTLFCILSKGTSFIELQVLDAPHCPPNSMGAKILKPTAITGTYWYGTVFMFWYRQVATIFLPFFALVFVNVIIVIQDRYPCTRFRCCAEMEAYRRRRLRPSFRKLTTSSHTQMEMADLELQYQSLLMSVRIPHQLSRWVNRARERVRKSDTRTLVLIVLEQLFTSALSLVITVWEHVHLEGLLTHLGFYLIATDFISIFSLLACALRLPTYLIADVTFREEIMWLVTCHTWGARDYLSTKKIIRRIPDSFHPQLIGAPNTMTLYPPGSRLKMRRNAIVVDSDLIAPGPGFAGIALSAYRRRESIQRVRASYDSATIPEARARVHMCNGSWQRRTMSMFLGESTQTLMDMEAAAAAAERNGRPHHFLEVDGLL